MLNSNNIFTAYELMQQSNSWIQKYMSITGLKLVKELRGESCFDITSGWTRKKSITTEHLVKKLTI